MSLTDTNQRTSTSQRNGRVPDPRPTAAPRADTKLTAPPTPDADLARPPIDVDNIELPPHRGRLRALTKRPRAMHYNRLAAAVVATNLVIAVLGATRWGWWTSDGIALGTISNVVLANFALAILIRQQHVINLLFKIATSAPTTWPLAIRWTLAKVYHFGGLHVGGASAGTVWFLAFSGSLMYQWANGPLSRGGEVSGLLVGISALLLAVLIAIVALAVPPMRAKHHDLFERSHRFGGWTSLALFWVHAGVFVENQRGESSWTDAMLRAPALWLLIAITISIVLPWLHLKKVPVEIVSPSNHVALTKFDHGVTPFAGSATAVSRSPLLEWHSFANVPSPGEEGFRLTISRAGDWTGQLIDDQPSHVWVKGVPTAGVANIETLFKKVIYVATGSGIGPCLPHLLAEEVPSRLIWATRNARATYGDDVVDEIMAVQPDAIIWDTDKFGKPDMVKLAYEAYLQFDAEAVICISNKKLTWQVVQGMEERGIPAYGAIWDS